MKKVLLLAIMLVATAGFGQTASRDKVLELITITGSRDNINKTLDAFKAQILQTIIEQGRGDKKPVTDNDVQSMRQFVDVTISQKMLDRMIDLIVPIYQKHFTDAEIDDMLAFYHTPTGKKMLTESPKIMVDYMGQLGPLVQDMQKETEERMKAQPVHTENQRKQNR
jgi:hypothetical protein